MWGIRILKFVIMIGVIWYFMLPLILDIPCLIQKRYSEVSGTVISKASDYKRGKDIKLKDDSSGEVLDLQVFGGEVEVSENVTIVYLPHLKIGNLKQ